MWIYFLGGMFVISSLNLYLKHRIVMRNGIEVDATVVRTERNSDPEVGVSYLPVFQYSVEGEQFTTRYYVGNTKPKYADGEHVLIYYHKKNPKKVTLAKDPTRTLFIVSFLIAGILAICFNFSSN